MAAAAAVAEVAAATVDAGTADDTGAADDAGAAVDAGTADDTGAADDAGAAVSNIDRFSDPAPVCIFRGMTNVSSTAYSVNAASTVPNNILHSPVPVSLRLFDFSGSMPLSGSMTAPRFRDASGRSGSADALCRVSIFYHGVSTFLRSICGKSVTNRAKDPSFHFDHLILII